MDPISAVGIAAAVVQFTDFTGRLLSETWRIYRSPTGFRAEDFELKVVASDLARLTNMLESYLEAGVPARDDSAEAEILKLCHECKKISADLQRTVTRAAKGKESLSKSNKSRSAGDAFRTALSAMWNREKVASVKRSLDIIRARLFDAVTTSLWLNSQDTKSWEIQFGKKLDHAIHAFESAVAKNGEAGPQVSKPEPDGARRIESQINAAVQRNNINNDVIRMIWDPEWDPDPTLLAHFPENTSYTPEQIGRQIARTLRYETIYHRDESIPSNYKSTYGWVFERSPRDINGDPAWSSVPDWLEAEGNETYWLTGKPGSGKSTMMKFMMRSPRLKEHLRVWSKGLPIHVGHYYAWNPGNELDKSQMGLKRSILHQIISANPVLAATLCTRRWTLFHTTRNYHNFPEWSEWELDESFTLLLRYTKTNVHLFLLIDGLDEFDAAPKSTIDLIRRIAAEPFIKVCAASRPWPDFQDAFLGCPSIQMHRLTQNDIWAFTNLRFSESPAFLEMADIYPEETRMLIEDIVVKSNGVFLWTAIVTQNLLESLSEGARLRQLQTILDQLPSDIEKLYESILGTIPPRLLPEMAAMLLIFKAACNPLPWFRMWLADEIRDGNLDHNSAIISHNSRYKALPSLKRRLAARTRGFLEVTGPPDSQVISYFHRTVAEWTQRPGVWEQISLESSTEFDPCLCLFTAETLLMCPPPPEETENRLEELRKSVSHTLFYASQCRVPSTRLTEMQFVASLDTFHKRAQNAFANLPRIVPIDEDVQTPWTHGLAPQGKMNNFLGVAAQFCIEPYVRLNGNEESLQFRQLNEASFYALLEQVVHGPQGWIRPYALEYMNMNKQTESRLRMAELLIQHGLPCTPELRKDLLLRAAKDEKFFQDLANLTRQCANPTRPKLTNDKNDSLLRRFRSMLNKAR